MAHIRNVSPDALNVRHPLLPDMVVEPDEVVEVPAAAVNLDEDKGQVFIWPESLWEVDFDDLSSSSEEEVHSEVVE